MWTFYKALFKNPRAVGSVIPSSHHLAKKIASFIPLNKPGWTVELGAGTGVITHALLQQGIPCHQLIVIEHSPDFANELKARFPLVNIIEANATQLSQLLADKKGEIAVIVSSIPLLSLPPLEKDKVIAEIENVLTPGSYYIQYSYGFHKSEFEFKARFKKIASERIWWNIPPARIDVFEFQ